MFGIGVQELAIIFVVALLIFGPKRLPELARTLGKGLAEFRRASSDLRHSFDVSLEDRPAAPAPRPGAQKIDPREQRELDSVPQQAAGEPGEEHGDDAQPAEAAEGAAPAAPAKAAETGTPR